MTQDETETLRDLLEQAKAISAGITARGGQVQSVNLPPAQTSISERAAWAAVVVAGFSLVVVYMQGQRIDDLNAAMARETVRREAHEAWAIQESNTIRGYVWTGKVPQVNPHPKQQAIK